MAPAGAVQMLGLLGAERCRLLVENVFPQRVVVLDCRFYSRRQELLHFLLSYVTEKTPLGCQRSSVVCMNSIEAFTSSYMLINPYF